MSRPYATSKLRLVLFVALIGAGIFLLAGTGLAQTAGAAAGTEATKAEPEGIFSIILHNLDFVFWTIALCSVIGVTLIIQGFTQNRASVVMPEASTEKIRELISQRQFKELIEFTETDPSFVSRALNPALKRAPSFSAMKEAMETSVGEQTAEQFRKIEYLNIIGNLGPLLGLLGTVLGMIDAFSAMNAAGGNASPSELAGGISKALAHTMLGLILAVPCLASFGVLRTLVDRLTIRAALLSEELLLMIKPEGKPAAAKPAARASAAPQPRKAPPAPVPTPAPAT
jgi:biopolymer transport protein ExbB